MRLFARIGTTLAVVAVVAATTTGTASAASASFKVNVNHSSGVLAGSTWAHLSWSISARTVTFSDAHLYARAGERVHVTWVAYQGGQSQDSTQATLDRRNLSNYTVDYDPFSLTADIPGGIDQVIVRIYDVDHDINHYANCYRSTSSCAIG